VQLAMLLARGERRVMLLSVATTDAAGAGRNTGSLAYLHCSCIRLTAPLCCGGWWGDVWPRDWVCGGSDRLLLQQSARPAWASALLQAFSKVACVGSARDAGVHRASSFMNRQSAVKAAAAQRHARPDACGRARLGMQCSNLD
jgi:hypothetical protein